MMHITVVPRSQLGSLGLGIPELVNEIGHGLRKGPRLFNVPEVAAAVENNEA